MDVEEQFRRTVSDYKGGAPALAPRVDKSVTSLQHEANGTGAAKQGLKDSLKIMKVADDYRILFAMAAECGFRCERLPSVADAGGNTAEHGANVAAEFADVLRAYSRTIADGRVSLNELREVRHEIGGLVAALQHMEAHLAARHQVDIEDRPLYAPLRAAA